MAVNFVFPLLIPLEENILNATRLFSENPPKDLKFNSRQYCVILSEDTSIGSSVVTVQAKQKEGLDVRYSITGGNRDGLFTIDQWSGAITIAAPLDRELESQMAALIYEHELIVAGESNGQVTHTLVRVAVVDVNDNAPQFVNPNPTLTIIEEDDRDLPSVLIQTTAEDQDWVDRQGLLYTATGEGIDGYSSRDAFFSINPKTGDIIQLRPLDRDPPNGKPTWKITVKAHDGQFDWSSLRNTQKSTFHHHDSNVSSKTANESPLPGRHNARRKHHRVRRSNTLKNAKIEDKSLLTNLQTELKYLEENTKSYILCQSQNNAFMYYNMLNESSTSYKGNEICDIVIDAYTNNKFRSERHSINEDVQDSGRSKSNCDLLYFPKYVFLKVKQIKRVGENTFITDHQPFIGNEDIRVMAFINLNNSSLLRLKSYFENNSKQMFNFCIDKITKYEINREKLTNNPSTSLQKRNARITKSSKVFAEKTKRISFPHQKDYSLSEISSRESVNDGHWYKRNKVNISKVISDDNLEMMKTKAQRNVLKFQRIFRFTNSNNKTQVRIRRHPNFNHNKEANQPLLLHVNTKYLDRFTNKKIKYSSMMERKSSYPNVLKSETTNEVNILLIDNQKSNPETKTESSKMYKRIKRNESGSPTDKIMVDSGGCLQMDTTATDHDSDMYSIHDAQLRHMASQVMRGHNHRSRGNVHVVETTVTIIVKDINDNPPVFPNSTIYGEVQENGPIDLQVATVTAWDADDDTSGTNARLTYSIEKNVVDEKSGEALFAVHPRTGELRTAICCLDRETTPEYRLQVVASDGGGLKGTGTVVVRLVDVNDNSPKISKKEWNITIDETLRTATPSNETILEITVLDPDVSNYFFFKVVEASGWGWDHFDIRTAGSVGELYAIKPLDYEDETHRQGFKFKVQVTDKGRGGWSDPRHVDSTWVSVKLRDINDNPPMFTRRIVRLNVREDVPPGTLLTTMKAFDPDQKDVNFVDYKLLDSWSRLRVDTDGGIKVRLPLDREGPSGSTFSVRVVAIDRGSPPRSSTATLSLTLEDVNDCPPRLLPPIVLHVKENTPKQMIGTLFATDDDIWSLGHGPPFNISLAPSNSEEVRRKISLKFKRELDSGRGGAEIWTNDALDREENRQITVDIKLADASRLIRTQPIVIIVDDVNDNRMHEGSKDVHLWKTRDSRAEAPLGRVYVDDPDDWDIEDKTFQWEGKPNSLFSLNPDFGTIFASGQVHEGKYELKFSVSDRKWRQKSVKANVSVTVRLLDPDALTHAIPLTLSPTTPAALTKDWTPVNGGGGLGYLTSFIKKVLEGEALKVEVVSVYGSDGENESSLSQNPSFFYSYYKDHDDPYVNDYFSLPNACVWISVMSKKGSYINSIKLKGLIQLQLKQLESLTNLKISTGDPSGHTGLSTNLHLSSIFSKTSTRNSMTHPPFPPSPSFPPIVPSSGDTFGGFPLPSYVFNPASAASVASMSLPLQLVDSNTTSLVTPRLSTVIPCPNLSQSTGTDNLDQCTSLSCLNGGRCILTDKGKRCICPGNTVGPQCKILSRSFGNHGWAWLAPFPRCFPLKIEMNFMSDQPDGLLLYSGPLTTDLNSQLIKSRRISPYLSLQLQNGELLLLVEGSEGAVAVKANAIDNLADNAWHSAVVFLSDKGASVMIDMCASNNPNCIGYASWPLPWKGGHWGKSAPLQIGGLAHYSPNREEFGWEYWPVEKSLHGCITDLRIGGELIDLGEVAYSHNSKPGCQHNDKPCETSCGIRGKCLIKNSCSCAIGWTGESCNVESEPATFKKGSFAKIALSFIPEPSNTAVQFQFRTRKYNSSLLSISAGQHSIMLSIFIKKSLLCISLSKNVSIKELKPIMTDDESDQENSDKMMKTNKTLSKIKKKTELRLQIQDIFICVSKVNVSDGEWHLAKGTQNGNHLILEVDDGHLWKRNSSIDSFLKLENKNKFLKNGSLSKKKKTLNGRVTLVIGDTTPSDDDKGDINEPTNEIFCINDVRVSGHPLPLPPSINGSRWGQVTMMSGIETGCHSTNVCDNVVCNAPFVCKDIWWKASCGCPANYRTTSHGCHNIDMCLYNPCLNGGRCDTQKNGTYSCLCSSNDVGRNCEWRSINDSSRPLTGSLIVIGSLCSLLFLVLLFGCILYCCFSQRCSDKKHLHKKSKSMSSDDVKKRAYYTDKSGRMHSDVSSTIESSLGFIQDMKESSALKKNSNEMHKICPSNFNRQITDAQISNLLTGATENSGRSATALPPDDLRAYAYEGDESSAGSLGSAISGLRQEFNKELEVIPIASEFNEVIDLLKNLPEAEKSSQLSSSQTRSCSILIPMNSNESDRSERRLSLTEDVALCCFSSEYSNSSTLPNRTQTGLYDQTDYRHSVKPLPQHKMDSLEIAKKTGHSPYKNSSPKKYVSCISKTEQFIAVQKRDLLTVSSVSQKQSTKL